MIMIENKIKKCKHQFYSWDDLPHEFHGECNFLDEKGRITHYLNLLSGKIRHKENGPAVIKPYTKYWFRHDILHRLDGPAVVGFNNNRKDYFINDFWYEEQEYWNHPLVIEYKLNKILNEK